MVYHTPTGSYDGISFDETGAGGGEGPFAPRSMKQPLRVLVVEDSEDDFLLLLHQLRAGDFDPSCRRIASENEMKEALAEPWDIVISDYVLPGFGGIAALDLLKSSGRDIPFIIVSGKIGEETAVDAMRAGAHDFIVKGNLARLVPAVSRELREAESRLRGRLADEELSRYRGHLEEMVQQRTEELRRSNTLLEEEIRKREVMDAELREHRDHLDRLVRERTAELRKANKDLRGEIMRRIQMEKDLIESQRFVHRIADATPNILYLHDLIEDKTIYVNPSVKDILGFTPEEIRKMGSFFSNLIHPDDMPRMQHLLDRYASAADGDVIESEFRLRNSRDEWRWLYSRDAIFKRSPDGSVRIILGIAQDITEKKAADQQLRESREQLRVLLARHQSVREDERSRISREIHDELGQALTALKMDLAWLGRRLGPDQEQLLGKTKTMSRLIDTNIQTVKRISAELRPGLLDDLGLTAALEWQAEEFKERTGTPCVLSITPDDIVLGKDLSITIFRIFQETLTNVVRHASAKKVWVSLTRDGRGVVLQVKDNGKGITEKQLNSPASIGLIGMRERVHFLGGTIDISSSPRKGTTVTVHLPLNHGENAGKQIQ